MGIDVYLCWDNMSEDEHKAQFNSGDTDGGKIGYLRESYHGEPYATRVLMPEGWDQALWDGHNDDCLYHCPHGEVRIPAATLVGRLEETCGTAIRRAELVYSDDIDQDDPHVQAFIDFVKLVQEKELAGLDPRIFVSY